MNHRFRTGLLAGTAALTALAALALPGTATATADQVAYPWNTTVYNFGSTAGTTTFTFTNYWNFGWVDLIVPFPNPKGVQVVGNTCASQVEPGASCQVTVAFTPTGAPVADTLQLQFQDPAGDTITSAPLYLYGGGAEYVTTDYPGDIVTFPETAVGSTSVITTIIHLIGPGPIDYPIKPVGPFHLVNNTCANVQAGAGYCEMELSFSPTSPGSFSMQGQMSFTDPVSGQPVSAPVITLEGDGD